MYLYQREEAEMFRDECGEPSQGSFRVLFDEALSSRIKMAQIPPWIASSDGGVSGQLNTVSAEYARYWSQDAIEIQFCCKAWFGEALLDRDQAGQLLEQLQAAVAAYDAREPARQECHYHHILPDPGEIEAIERLIGTASDA